jgi:hypothetical protein
MKSVVRSQYSQTPASKIGKDDGFTVTLRLETVDAQHVLVAPTCGV